MLAKIPVIPVVLPISFQIILGHTYTTYFSVLQLDLFVIAITLFYPNYIHVLLMSHFRVEIICYKARKLLRYLSSAILQQGSTVIEVCISFVYRFVGVKEREEVLNLGFSGLRLT